MMFDILTDAKRINYFIKYDPVLPVDTGWLKRHIMVTPKNNQIKVFLSGSKVRYAVYLQEGTSPHDIPNAFGRGQSFGIGGKFEGKFHPGSTKHKNFIENVLVKDCIKYFVNYYDVVKITKGGKEFKL